MTPRSQKSNFRVAYFRKIVARFENARGPDGLSLATQLGGQGGKGRFGNSLFALVALLKRAMGANCLFALKKRAIRTKNQRTNSQPCGKGKFV